MSPAAASPEGSPPRPDPIRTRLPPAGAAAAPLDFETITNPLGPPARVRAALADLDPAAVPDSEWRALREALASSLGVPLDRVWAGERLLLRLAQALLRPGHRALLFTPSPQSYLDTVLAAGAEAIQSQARLRERSGAEGWDWDLRHLGELLHGLGVACALLGHPNDPTGAYLGPEEIARLARRLAPALLVLDERLLPFAESPWESLPLRGEHPNLILLGSLGVAYGLGSLEADYVVGDARLVRRLRTLQGPLGPRAAAAQTAGLAALQDPGHVEHGRQVAQQGAALLRQGCRGMGLAVAPARASFVLVRTGDGATTVQQLREAGFRVLDCAPLGLPAYIRIAPRHPTQCRALLAALAGPLAP